jgi:anti-sigma regulatory factor (Ser/Thr protein kinase)
MTPAAGQATARPPCSRYASAELDPDPAAAAKARRLIRDHLARWHMDYLADDAQAIVSELAANAIAAVPAGSPGLCLLFAIHHRPPELRIIMWDNGPGQPCPANPGHDAETGRGLAIIDHLTSRNWGWWSTPRSGGKVVWAALTTSGHHDGGEDSRC